ncbi:hypothetical protein IPZ70_15870 [Streptomyces polychromogenes]|nr:hypothetical protein [Streptomyces polychromogenes]
MTGRRLALGQAVVDHDRQARGEVVGLYPSPLVVRLTDRASGFQRIARTVACELLGAQPADTGAGIRTPDGRVAVDLPPTELRVGDHVVADGRLVAITDLRYHHGATRTMILGNGRVRVADRLERVYPPRTADRPPPWVHPSGEWRDEPRTGPGWRWEAERVDASWFDVAGDGMHHNVAGTTLGLADPVYVTFLSALSELLAFAAVGLVAVWGEVFPGWIPVLCGRRVPLLAAVIPAALGSAILIVLWTALAVQIGSGVTLQGDPLPDGFPTVTLQGWRLGLGPKPRRRRERPRRPVRPGLPPLVPPGTKPVCAALCGVRVRGCRTRPSLTDFVGAAARGLVSVPDAGPAPAGLRE